MRRAKQRTRNFKVVTAGLALAGAIGLSPLAQAGSIADGNVSAEITGSSVPIWEVNGTNQLGAAGIQLFYRTGGSGPATPIDSLPAPNPAINFGVGEEQTFAGDGYDIRVSIDAIGGEPAKLPINIRVSKNASDDTALNEDFDIFVLTDADVAGTLADGGVSITGGGQNIDQPDDAGQRYFGNSSFTFGEDGTTIGWQGGTGGELEGLLGGAGFTDLSNGNSVVPGGDGAFAIQWSFPFDALAGANNRTDDSFTVAIQNNISPQRDVIPEPVTGLLSLMGLSALGTLVAGRRRTA
jgi:hypothetical protein